MSLVNITPIQNGEEADDDLFNERFTALADVINGNLDSTNLASNAVNTPQLADASVLTPKLADGAVTNAKLATATGEVGGTWQSWTPTWTNVSFGTGPTTAYNYVRIGKFIIAEIFVQMGASPSVSGTGVTFSLPVTANARYANGTRFSPAGEATLHDSGTDVYFGKVYIDNSTAQANMLVQVTTASYVSQKPLDATTPYALASGDSWAIQIRYEAA